MLWTLIRMLRTVVISATVLLSALSPAFSEEATLEPTETLDHETAIAREAGSRRDSSALFIEAAKRRLSGSGNQSALALLSSAEEARGRALDHFEKGEFDKAFSGFSESAGMAVNAIIAADNDATVQRVDLEARLAERFQTELERQALAMEKKGFEVRAFIATAERLMAQSPDAVARDLLDRARAELGVAMSRLENHFYPSAREHLDNAYGFAVASVKANKAAAGDIITFPWTGTGAEEDRLSYELKKNDTYAFFALQMVGERRGGPYKFLKKGKTLRDKGLEARDSGRADEAIASLKASTEYFIGAIRALDR